jgi:hypothetical protein
MRDDDEQYFTADRQMGEGESFPSLSGRYTLTISEYRTEANRGDYSRGIVRDKVGNVVADVKRNYGAFPFCFVEHPNGHEYLVCGEDYQGQTVAELDTGKRVDYVPPEAQEGLGFCWAAIESAENATQLRVEGCYWVCPYEIVLYDFSRPLALPYSELSRSPAPPE